MIMYGKMRTEISGIETDRKEADSGELDQTGLQPRAVPISPPRKVITMGIMV